MEFEIRCEGIYTQKKSVSVNLIIVGENDTTPTQFDPK